MTVAEPVDPSLDETALSASHGHKPARYWNEVAAPFKGPDTKKSVLQLLTSAGLFLGCWIAMFFSLEVSYLLTLALAVPTAAFVMRLFMIQHDCGHGSYFKSKKARDIVGFWIGVVTLTPYGAWRQSHAYHHSHSGDLDFRGFGDIHTITLREYRAMSKRGRFLYRLYRHPLTLLGIGPAFFFLIKHRYPWDLPRSWKGAWTSVWKTNLCLAAIFAIATYTIGLDTFLLIQVPTTLIACSLGVYLFYVQHQFEDTYWHRHENWDYFDAAVFGSSHFVLPRPLQWVTANIGIHHVHHLNSQIPNYKLEACLRSNEKLQQARRITLADTWKLFRLSLWDEETEQMIGFRDLKRLSA